MTSLFLQISKICYKLSQVCSPNYASPEPEPVLTHLSVLGWQGVAYNSIRHANIHHT